MQDFIRTSTYQKAILDNPVDFSGKIVLDVGAGSGILSFFAYQSGAKRVSNPLWGGGWYSLSFFAYQSGAKRVNISLWGVVISPLHTSPEQRG